MDSSSALILLNDFSSFLFVFVTQTAIDLHLFTRESWFEFLIRLVFCDCLKFASMFVNRLFICLLFGFFHSLAFFILASLCFCFHRPLCAWHSLIYEKLLNKFHIGKNQDCLRSILQDGLIFYVCQYRIYLNTHFHSNHSSKSFTLVCRRGFILHLIIVLLPYSDQLFF